MKDKNIIICDIDGTIANLQHRLHFIKNPDGSKKKKPDWDSFHKECINDEPYTDVIEILHSLVLGMGNGCGVCGAVEREVYFFSGRNASVRNETAEWLEKHVPITLSWSDYEQYLGAGEPEEWQHHLHMRSEGDRRPDTVVKLEMLQAQLFSKDEVLCILDDRQAVVDMWRANGFRVMQVDAWKEPAPVHHLTQEKLESLNKAELMFLIEHERKHFEKHMEVKVGDLALYNRAKRALRVLNETTWQDELRDHVDKTAKEHDTSKWTQTGKGTSPNTTPIPMLDTPDFDLGDIPEENSSVAEQNLAADEYINRKLEKKEDEK